MGVAPSSQYDARAGHRVLWGTDGERLHPAVLSTFARPALPWWENLVVAAVLSGVLVLTVARIFTPRSSAAGACYLKRPFQQHRDRNVSDRVCDLRRTAPSTC
jgi:hypothetical protein